MLYGIDLVVLLFCVEGFGMVVLEVIFVVILVFILKFLGIVLIFWKVKGGDFVVVVN